MFPPPASGFAYFAYFAVLSVFYIGMVFESPFFSRHPLTFAIVRRGFGQTAEEESFIVNIAPDGGNISQNVTECNGECNGSKMRKCLGFNMCNGVTAVSEQHSGADPALLPAVVLAKGIPEHRR